MSDVRLRVALLGAGRIGQEHSKSLIADPRVQVVAVCDPRLEAARQTAATIPGAIATDQSAEIFSSSEVDGVIICTPTDSHGQLIEEGARAHKAIFCEKPVALDLQRTKHALAVVEENGVPFQIGFQRRFDSGYAEARKRIARGLLGRIDQFRAELDAFFTAILERTKPSPSAADAIGALRIGLAATRSQKLGRVVKLEEVE
jgi:myo-inositol 2-dehydrogenase / D-chiro-inositol 1-dehydrogenase